MTIKAKPTPYNGHHFRSRLEARWAVFYDELGIKWVYEPETFEFPDGTLYLPDFYLPGIGAYVEIKPAYPTPDEIRKAELLSRFGEVTVRIFYGLPREYGEVRITGVDIGPGPRPLVFDVSCSGNQYRGWGLLANKQSTEDEALRLGILAANKAASARFEFGESGATL